MMVLEHVSHDAHDTHTRFTSFPRGGALVVHCEPARRPCAGLLEMVVPPLLLRRLPACGRPPDAELEAAAAPAAVRDPVVRKITSCCAGFPLCEASCG